MIKLIKKFVRFTIIFLMGPPCLFIYLLKPIIFFRFGIIQSSRIGGFAFQSYAYLLNDKNSLSSDNKYNIFYIISFEEKICNKQLALLLSRKIKIFPYSRINRLIIESIRFWHNDHKRLNIERDNGRSHIIKLTVVDCVIKNKINLDINSEEKKRVEMSLNSIGIKKENSWVCIHNRDSAYLNYYYKNQNFSYHDYRNFRISSMISTCNYFLSKGYHVIRLGKIADHKIELTHPKLIDYPFSNIKDELLEFHLMSNCKYYIGCDSGPVLMPLIYKKPVLLTNYTDLTTLNLIKHFNYLITLRLFLDIKTNKILTLKEIFLKKLNWSDLKNSLTKLNIKLIDSSSDEILEASQELEKIDYNKYEENYLQKEFWNIIDKYNDKNEYNLNNIYISSYFLKKHENTLFN